MSTEEETQVDESGAERAAAVATEVVEDVATTANQQGPKQIGLNDLDCGYIVGVKDGNFVFDIIGKDKDLLKLVGVHKYADLRVTQTFERTQMVGDTLTHELGKALHTMNQKLDMLVQTVRKPDTEI